MARKRLIIIEKKEEANISEDSVEIPEKYKDSEWGVWTKNTYAKYWFALVCLLLDSFLGLEIARQTSGSLSVSIPILVVVVLVFAEAWIYLRLWGKRHTQNPR